MITRRAFTAGSAAALTASAADTMPVRRLGNQSLAAQWGPRRGPAA